MSYPSGTISGTKTKSYITKDIPFIFIALELFLEPGMKNKIYATYFITIYNGRVLILNEWFGEGRKQGSLGFFSFSFLFFSFLFFSFLSFFFFWLHLQHEEIPRPETDASPQQ